MSSVVDLFAALKTLSLPIAVACSGGLDSTALLHAVSKLPAGTSDTAHTRPIALHVNHGIHPDSSAWAAQVARQAHQFRLRFDSEIVLGLHTDMPSLEAAARDARHAALRRLCAKHGIKTLLFAHHANDQAETVLLNLLRGTGLAGVGMPRTRVLDMGNASTPTQLVRPWLDVPRAQIEQYARAHQLNWVEDPSNADTTLRRNAVRHTLWPVIEQVEPRALPSLARFADLALAAHQTESGLASKLLAAYTAANGTLDWYTLCRDEPATIQHALLRAYLTKHSIRAPSAAQLAAMCQQLNARTGDGLRCSLAGFELVFAGRRLQAIKSSKEANPT